MWDNDERETVYVFRGNDDVSDWAVIYRVVAVCRDVVSSYISS